MTIRAWTIESVVGRLLTDEQCRLDFLADPQRQIERMRAGGFAIDDVDGAALLETSGRVWRCGAERIDPRLQKASLGPRPHARAFHDPADEGGRQ